MLTTEIGFSRRGQTMAIPHRGTTGNGTYFITSASYQKMSLFQAERMGALFLDVLRGYQTQGKYLIHEFVLMPDHFHLLLTPNQSLEKAVQLIKGGFSYRAKKDLGYGGEIWEHSFYDRRVRDAREYEQFREYIHQNPVKRGLAVVAPEYRYSSAAEAFPLNAAPRWLKPV
jgi:REP-associated tyrosine transposase